MDYGSAISSVVPGTFVPDLGKAAGADETPNVGPIPGAAPTTGVAAGQGPSFKETLSQMIGGVNDKLNVSDQAMRDLADGKTNDDQKVLESTEEANLALSYLTAIRSKLITAYQQVEQMQI
ncbi:MAG TPA: flagellar hook-basal body complex protein FliE [Candidatus Acidoferrum sp.]|nr:flagellar hook-basal body complex protein FliE [Candidatus Acidoferrum sp.]